MPKENGLGWTRLTVADAAAAGQDIRNDVTNWQFATPRGVQDVTGIDKSAMERLLLLADFSMTVNFVFNDAVTNSVHSVFKTVPTTSVPRAVGLTISGQLMDTTCIFTDYNYNRNADGSLTGSAPGVLSSGVAPTWA